MDNTRKALVGAFVVGGLGLFAIALFLVGDRRLLFQPQFALNTAFGKVTGLQVGSKVRLAGLDAGEVLAIVVPSRPSEKFVVRMRVRQDLRPLIRTDSVAAVQTDGIVGSAFIQIGRGTDEAPMIEPDGMIAGNDPIEFADLIQEGRATFQAVSREIADVGDDVSQTVATLTETAATANMVLADASGDLKRLTASTVRVSEGIEGIVADTRVMVGDVRAGRGTIGKLITDDSQYKRWVSITGEAEQAVVNLRDATNRARSLVEQVGARDGAAQQMVQALHDTLMSTREVMSDISEGTEALKRNFLFRGFFRDRGFYDLDTLSREAYLTGALESNDRTALRIWIGADGLFERRPDGTERLTDAGRQRLDSAMADLVRYPASSPLIVEGYADAAEGDAAYLVSADRAQIVREYLIARFRRRITLTGIMPLSTQAPGSPRGNEQWSGVALALFVDRDAIATSR
jgi:phospholipid/cholesterol/gamma-HCH transport system substrate-binding protein